MSGSRFTRGIVGGMGGKHRSLNLIRIFVLILAVYGGWVMMVEKRIIGEREKASFMRYERIVKDIEERVRRIEKGRLTENGSRMLGSNGEEVNVGEIRRSEVKVVSGDKVGPRAVWGVHDDERLLVYEGFEGGTLEPMGDSPLSKCPTRRWRKEFNLDGMKVVHKRDGHPVRGGNFSLMSHFTSRDKNFIRPEPGHDHKFRSEILLSNVPTFTDGAGRGEATCGKATCCLECFPFRKEYSLDFSIFAPADWKIDMPDDDERNDDKDTSLMQFHGVPEGRFTVDNSNEMVTVLDRNLLKEQWRSPPLLLSLTNMKDEYGRIIPAWAIRQVHDPRSISEDGLSMVHRRRWTTPAWRQSAVDDLGKWTDFSFNVKFSWEEDGVMAVYKNGNMVMNHTGPNCFNDQVAPRIHFGLYKWNWRIPEANDTKHAFEKIVYYDNIRVYNGFRNLR